ncbi:tripartite tricarboxylate transporter substrate binding protein [Pararoseomonas sp. SCSIO 73927]|uniref:Bug family tripartite tricarboxylate transporter substrate binding protein n=1 Tax=Pararoseomonas sp. SCSIO 73927 TaxID=3114537 RepID=UPI0030D5BC5E
MASSHLSRRALLATLPPLTAARPARAAWKPSRPVSLVVGFAAGSGTDAVSRVVAPLLAEEIGAGVVVENRPGANGALAASFVARARPDGQTVLMATNTTHAGNPALMRRLDYDPVRDFTAAAYLGSISFVLLAARRVPARGAAEFVSWAKAQPSGVTAASANAHGLLGMSSLARSAGFSVTNVPYSSAAQALTDISAGRVDAVILDVIASIGQIRAEALTPIAVMGGQRSSLLPEVPTLREAGIPAFEVEGWMGVVAPAGVPNEVGAALSDALGRIVARPELRSRLAAIGFDVRFRPAHAFAELIAADLRRWSAAAREAGIEPE